MIPNPRLLAVAIAAALTLPALAHAADEADDDPKRAKTLDTVEVHGTREPQQSSNQNVVKKTASDLEDEQAESMEDLIRYIPGVSVSEMGRFGDNGFNIRGIEGDRVAMTVDGLPMAEGLETARSYEFFRAGQGGVDIDSLKSVEVIKGADSITAGSGALGGAVLFTTKDARDYLDASGNDTYVGGKFGYTGHNEEKLGSLTLANRTGIVESMLVYTRRKAQESEGWYDSTAIATGSARRLPDPIDHDSTNVLAKLDFVLSDAHRLGFVYERNRVENLVDNLSRVSPPGYLTRVGDDSNSRDRYGLVYHWAAGNAAFDDMELRIDRQETESRGITRILAGSGTSANPTPTPRTTPCTLALPCNRTEDRSTSQTLDKIALDFGKQAGSHALAWGAAVQERGIDYTATDYRWNNTGELDTATVDPAQVPGTDVRAWNLYLRNRISLLDDRLQLSLGARYDRYDYLPTLSPTFKDTTGSVRDVSFSAPSGQFGISYEFLPNQSLWFQAGRGFRAPTTGEMYAPTSTTQLIEVATGNVVTVPNTAANPDLQAETSLNLEAGWRWQSDRARFGISVFRDRYDDFIDSTRILVNPNVKYACTRPGCAQTDGYLVTTTANVGTATIKGVELEGQWQLAQSWLLRAAWTHNDGEDAFGKPLNSINPDRGVIGLSWQGMDGRLRLTGNLTHAAGKREADVQPVENVMTGTVTYPYMSNSYTVFDLSGSYRFNEHLRINAGVYNLFDERYYQWARIRNVTPGVLDLYGYATVDGIGRYSEPGRNFRVSVSWNF
ncbi:MAG: TonB-dependent hemoglobin/transferrin/lactoferrin family receptor [Thermomonas sp.]|uniref:TonB-dependent hemoglobin/transferrin/lactoferrin family receptor n=1 Tax=Thermomonas sp. TaxID=1971895 RepID=UPI0039E3576F